MSPRTSFMWKASIWPIATIEGGFSRQRHQTTTSAVRLSPNHRKCAKIFQYLVEIPNERSRHPPRSAIANAGICEQSHAQAAARSLAPHSTWQNLQALQQVVESTME